MKDEKETEVVKPTLPPSCSRATKPPDRPAAGQAKKKGKTKTARNRSSIRYFTPPGASHRPNVETYHRGYWTFVGHSRHNWREICRVSPSARKPAWVKEIHNGDDQ
jgi:hypothetical protein